MPTPAALMGAIRIAIQQLQACDDFTPQQSTFVEHLARTGDHLACVFEPIPQDEAALKRIVPALSDAIQQQQVALFGYARLLLEQPESFGDAILSPGAQAQLQEINRLGQQLHTMTQEINTAAMQERKLGRHAQPAPTDLGALLMREAPILRYFVRDYAVQLQVNGQAQMATSSEYHLSALLQHIVVTVSSELIAYGHIRISTGSQPPEAHINVFCTGIQLTAEEQATLFAKNGREIYRKRLQEMGGHLRYLRDPGRGTTIQIVLRCAQDSLLPES